MRRACLAPGRHRQIRCRSAAAQDRSAEAESAFPAAARSAGSAVGEPEVDQDQESSRPNSAGLAAGVVRSNPVALAPEQPSRADRARHGRLPHLRRRPPVRAATLWPRPNASPDVCVNLPLLHSSNSIRTARVCARTRRRGRSPGHRPPDGRQHPPSRPRARARARPRTRDRARSRTRARACQCRRWCS